METQRHASIRTSAVLSMLLALVTATACISLGKPRTPEEKGIRRTDYQHSLAGVYTAPLPGSPDSPGQLLLAMYADGSCLFADKRYGREGAAVMTGRWDLDTHEQRVTLRLKTDSGAQRVMRLTHQAPDLKINGTDYGTETLLLMRKDAAAR